MVINPVISEEEQSTTSSDGEQTSSSHEKASKRRQRVFSTAPSQQNSAQSSFNPAQLLQTPFLQPQLFGTSIFSGFPSNFLPSPLLQPQFVDPILIHNTSALPMQSPLQIQSVVALAPNLLQGIVPSHETAQSPLRTGPINFTRDNVDYLWNFCNAQLG